MKRTVTYNIFVLLIAMFFLQLGCKQKKEAPEKSISVGPKIVASTESGIDISYTVTGHGDHALVFVHGWSCDQTYWDEQLKHFKDKYQVVTIDLGGHGKSDSNRDDWSMRSFGSDVLDVINTLTYKKVSFIGHSMGSVVVLDVVSRVEKQPEAVVFVDYFKNKPDPIPTKDEAIKRTTLFKEDFVNSTKGFVRNMFLPSSDSLLVNRIVNDMSSANPKVAVPAVISMIMTDADQGFNRLVSKKTNMHLINSDKRPTDRPYFDSLGIKVHTIPETAHFLMIEKPNDFNLLLERIVSDGI